MEPGEVAGGLKGRIAQLVMMAAQKRADEEGVERVIGKAAKRMRELNRGGGVDYLRQFETYLAATPDEHALEPSIWRVVGTAGTRKMICAEAWSCF